MARAVAEVWQKMSMGERLGLLRRRRRLSQKQLAAEMTRLGVPIGKSMISRFERWGVEDVDARKPQFVHLWAMAHILKVGRLEDLGATEDEYPEIRLMRQGIATPSKLGAKAGRRSTSANRARNRVGQVTLWPGDIASTPPPPDPLRRKALGQ